MKVQLPVDFAIVIKSSYYSLYEYFTTLNNNKIILTTQHRQCSVIFHFINVLGDQQNLLL